MLNVVLDDWLFGSQLVLYRLAKSPHRSWEFCSEIFAVANLGRELLGKSNGGFSEGGFSNSRFVLQPDIAIASKVSILSKNSLAIADFHAKKTQHVQLFEIPLPGTPPFAIPKTWRPENAVILLDIPPWSLFSSKKSNDSEIFPSKFGVPRDM